MSESVDPAGDGRDDDRSIELIPDYSRLGCVWKRLIRRRARTEPPHGHDSDRQEGHSVARRAGEEVRAREEAFRIALSVVDLDEAAWELGRTVAQLAALPDPWQDRLSASTSVSVDDDEMVRIEFGFLGETRWSDWNGSPDGLSAVLNEAARGFATTLVVERERGFLDS